MILLLSSMMMHSILGSCSIKWSPTSFPITNNEVASASANSALGAKTLTLIMYCALLGMYNHVTDRILLTSFTNLR